MNLNKSLLAVASSKKPKVIKVAKVEKDNSPIVTRFGVLTKYFDGDKIYTYDELPDDIKDFASDESEEI